MQTAHGERVTRGGNWGWGCQIWFSLVTPPGGPSLPLPSLLLQQCDRSDKGSGDALLSSCCVLWVHFYMSSRFVLVRNVHKRTCCPPSRGAKISMVLHRGSGGQGAAVTSVLCGPGSRRGRGPRDAVLETLAGALPLDTQSLLSPCPGTCYVLNGSTYLCVPHAVTGSGLG